jgi:hypothetical protein
MDDRIKEHLKRLNKYYLRLSDTRKLEKEVFIREDLYQASSERYFAGVNPACPAAPLSPRGIIGTARKIVPGLNLLWLFTLLNQIAERFEKLGRLPIL